MTLVSRFTKSTKNGQKIHRFASVVTLTRVVTLINQGLTLMIRDALTGIRTEQGRTVLTQFDQTGIRIELKMEVGGDVRLITYLPIDLQT